jgi:hypothetical protein
MRAASGAAPGAIAQMLWRVDIAKKSLAIGRPRVADLGKPRVNPGADQAPM